MNSSLKQPYPVSLSLNDCLVKGPSALVDLFTVTLCIREHRYALTKDLSKFYQRVDADPIAQNLRRVMWRGGDGSAEMKVYITTTVNFGDKPAGCIAIAAARETADRFGAEFPVQTHQYNLVKPTFKLISSFKTKATVTFRRVRT